MKNKIHVVICIAFIVTAIAIPFAVEWLLSVTSWSFGSSDGWLGFWSGYLGSIISICFAYFNTKHQAKIDRNAKREKEERQLLPYFYINNLKSCNKFDDFTCVDCKGNQAIKGVWKADIGYETLSDSNVMIENTTASFYTKRKRINDESLGNIQRGNIPIVFKTQDLLYETDYRPENGKDISSVLLDDISSKSGFRLDISCVTALGNEVFYTYGNGLMGTGYYKSKDNWYIYLGSESDESKKRLAEHEKHEKRLDELEKQLLHKV